jgi:hypothetical protein
MLHHMNEMLKHPEYLQDREYAWVERISKTVARSSRMTLRQREVIEGIYTRFVARYPAVQKDIPRSAPTPPAQLTKCPACGCDIKAQNVERHRTDRCPVTKQKRRKALTPRMRSTSPPEKPRLAKSVGYIIREVAAQQAYTVSTTSSHRNISSPERSPSQRVTRASAIGVRCRFCDQFAVSGEGACYVHLHGGG